LRLHSASAPLSCTRASFYDVCRLQGLTCAGAGSIQREPLAAWRQRGGGGDGACKQPNRYPPLLSLGEGLPAIWTAKTHTGTPGQSQAAATTIAAVSASIVVPSGPKPGPRNIASLSARRIYISAARTGGSHDCTCPEKGPGERVRRAGPLHVDKAGLQKKNTLRLKPRNPYCGNPWPGGAHVDSRIVPGADGRRTLPASNLSMFIFVPPGSIP
jgi:hypothetical protein